jgi:acyl-CoA synthetase (AMP-forming)/AMP-acid ligase II
MAGYYKMPEKTAEAIDAEGWLHSGDLATMNAQGYLNIVGRLKDMVIRGGENLFPVEVEEFLVRHPKVAEVQVVGVPDAYFGEELLAVVIPRAGQRLSEEELRVFLFTSTQQMDAMLQQANQEVLSSAIAVKQLWDAHHMSWMEVRRLEIELGKEAIMIVPTPVTCLPRDRKCSPGRSCKLCESVVSSRLRWFLNSC